MRAVAERIRGQAHKSSAGKGRHRAVPSQGKGQAAEGQLCCHRADAGGCCASGAEIRLRGPDLTPCFCCSAVGGGREKGETGEKGRDGTVQRTLRQGVWEGNFMLAKRKVNTKYLIGIFFLLDSLVRLDFTR